jgi:hypothetical protein
MFKTYKGRYLPRNPEKYIGDANNIIYRSNWEQRLFYRLDVDPGVARWASEEFSIPYLNPIDNKIHRYFPDVYVENVNGEKFVIEIKPSQQTRVPEKPSKNSKKYITEVSTYLINKSKWLAADKFCEEKGWQFKIITEKDLGI